MRKAIVVLAVLIAALTPSVAFAQGYDPEINADLAQQLEMGQITLEEACATPGYNQINCKGLDPEMAQEPNPLPQDEGIAADQYSAPTVTPEPEASPLPLPATGGPSLLTVLVGAVLFVAGAVITIRLLRG